MEASFQQADRSHPLSLTPGYILPVEKRPLLSQVSSSTSIPIIDMRDELHVVDKISKACEEYGFFQIINHGIPPELCRRMMAVLSEFFHLPPEERARFCTDDPRCPVKVYHPYLGTGQDGEKVTMWSEYLSHPCHPLDGILHLLPDKPVQYREVVVAYAKEMGGLVKRLLGLISKGLGLESNYLNERLKQHKRILQANYYPTCPQPDLTLGLPVHTDLGVLTILQQSQGVTGLHVIKDGNWMYVDPIPDAFVINVGDQLQVMSNGRYKSVHHRAVINKSMARLSIATFYRPEPDVMIGPIEELVDDQHPALYQNYRFEEFFKEFLRQEGSRRRVKEVFELRH
ncbi:protein DMR6-LIKE OXYGENASE 1-like [Magnolia sinica]|uniref:protein DMR6-LIKE OXYGENASE 1-like n=1 Tax=Magnolia sinica TaxID=86752 RepID=UPI00265AE8A7|nr:protein DMR6-LIKE OXYGENASE 1-like [Magnolia sinica]